MSIHSNIAKARRYVPIAHYATAAIMVGAALLGDHEMRVWFIVAAVLSVVAGIGFYAFMRQMERKLQGTRR